MALTRAAAATGLVLALAAPASAADQPALSDIVDRASKSVVTVQAGAGQGTAFAFGRRGEFLTNAHVVGESARVTVVTGDGERSEAEVVAVDASRDVARLRSSLELEPLEPADGPPRPGDDVFAIGAPDGLDGTVTKGIVSANRDVEGQPMIQTDVAVNPGNSGGPLLSASGLVLGVTSAKATGQEGIAFAIPIDRAQEAAGAAPAPSDRGSSSPGAGWLPFAVLALATVGGLVALRRRRTAAAPVIASRPWPVTPANEDPLVLIRRRPPEESPDVVIHTNRSEN